MKGDFSRDTFRQRGLFVRDKTTAVQVLGLRRRRYSRVLQQQGRVQLDADWNEQVAIQTNLLRTYAADIIGRHGTPSEDKTFGGNGFQVVEATAANFPDPPPAPLSPKDLVILPGRYYVEGILCECTQPMLFSKQVDRLDGQPLNDGNWLVYLDVWERHLTAVEDPYLREVALGGPDTASRAQVVWQAYALSITDAARIKLLQTPKMAASAAMGALDEMAARRVPWMRARSNPKLPDEPCLLAPDAKYRGPENQLYRVEVHQPTPTPLPGTPPGPPATYKWSRDNGSVVYPIVIEAVSTGPAGGVPGTSVVVVEHLGHDDRSRLKVGDWVEFVDDAIVLGQKPGVLRQVRSIEDRRVTLDDSVPLDQSTDLHALLRLWQSKELPIPSLKADPTGRMLSDWIALEDGVEIQFGAPFEPNSPALQPTFRTGDYWIVPARVATGDVEWPGPKPDPDLAPPRGIDHVYAPLGFVNVVNATVSNVTDLRLKFDPLAR